jgi:hypothetical protein
MIEETKREGLNSGLKTKEKIKRAPKGSEDLKAFLLVVEKEIIDWIYDLGNGYKPNLKLEEIKVVNQNLKFTSMAMIPTYKTNSFKCIHIDDYKDWAIKHLLKNVKEITRAS